ncbi:hypothetical protein [Aurantimonas marina]|uniref:hypothetical protein n=1 Tax=Aurantimonas marina TaxID=2780508 RepID=UPI001AEE83B3|nr:hypothetical protein [Aurantimonas marina]
MADMDAPAEAVVGAVGEAVDAIARLVEESVDIVVEQEIVGAVGKDAAGLPADLEAGPVVRGRNDLRRWRRRSVDHDVGRFGRGGAE